MIISCCFLAVPITGSRTAAQYSRGQGRLLLHRVHQCRHVGGEGDHQRVLPPRRDREGAAERRQERRQEGDRELPGAGGRRGRHPAPRQQQRRAGHRLRGGVCGARGHVVCSRVVQGHVTRDTCAVMNSSWRL